MTVIRPNSISGITSITAQANEINIFRSDGTLAGLQINGVNFNTTAGISTLAALNVTGNVSIAGTLTYEDVTNIDSVGIITARSGIDCNGTLEVSSTSNFDGAVQIADTILHLGDTNTKIRFPANDTISFETSGAERLRIASDGDVGIGTVNPNAPLDVFSNTTATNKDLFMVRSATGAFAVQCSDGAAANPEWRLRTYSSEPIVFSPGNNEKLRIDSSGFVGIENTSPSSSQAGARNLVIGSGSGDRGLTIMSGTSGVGHIEFSDGTGSSAEKTAGGIRYYHNSNYMRFNTNGGTERLRITSAGRIGINKSDPDCSLHIISPDTGNERIICENTSNAANYQNQITFKLAGTTTAAIISGNDSGGNNFGLSFGTGSGQTERLRIASDGETLVKGDSNPCLSIDRGSANTTNINIKYNGSTRAQMSAASAAFEISAVGSTTPIKFYTNGNNHWQINESGVLYATGASAAKAGSIHIDYGASNNSDTDSAVYVTSTSNSDWSFKANKYAGTATDYCYYARVGNGASYAFGAKDAQNDQWRFRVNGAGSIFATNTTIQSISDRRLKENIVDANSQWNDIKALKWRNFTWKNDTDTAPKLGLIADEVESISPNLIEIDAQDKEDKDNGVPDPKYKTVKYSIVWMKAMKALQESQERIETLEAKVLKIEQENIALRTRVTNLEDN